MTLVESIEISESTLLRKEKRGVAGAVVYCLASQLTCVLYHSLPYTLPTSPFTDIGTQATSLQNSPLQKKSEHDCLRSLERC